MYVLNEYMEFGVDTPLIATYNFKLVFHLLFSTIYSSGLCLSATVDAPSRVHEGRSSLSAGQCQLLLCFASLRALLAAHIENISPG